MGSRQVGRFSFTGGLTMVSNPKLSPLFAKVINDSEFPPAFVKTNGVRTFYPHFFLQREHDDA